MLTVILTIGMETTFFRFINKADANREKVFSNSLMSVAMASAIFLISVLVFAPDIASWISDHDPAALADYIFYIKCLSYVLALDALCNIPFALLRFDNKPVRYGAIKVLNITIVVILNLFFLFGVPFFIKHALPGAAWMQQWYRPHWVGYIFLANTAGSVFTLLALSPQFFRFKFLFDKKLLISMLIYSWPVLIANVSYIINENIDKIMLSKMLPHGTNEQDVGIYGACAKISLFLSIFVQAFRLGAEPFFFNHAKNSNASETYARIMNYFVIVVSIIFIALSANIEILKYFIKGRDPVQQALYWSGLNVVPLLLFGYVSLGIYMNLSVWYKLSDQTRYGLYISGIGAILTIVLNIIFIPKYSYVASAWISLLAYATMMVLSYLWGQKNYPIPYNLKKNLAYITASLIIVFLSFSVFKRNLFIGNALLLIFVTASFFTEKKELFAILKKRGKPSAD